MRHGESLFLCNAFQCCVEFVFNAVGNAHIINGAAHAAHHVMVMAGEILAEFKSRPFVGGDHSHHHPGVFQHGEISIRRRLREALCVFQNFWNRQRALCLHQRINDGTSTGCEALTNFAQLRGHVMRNVCCLHVNVCVGTHGPDTIENE